MQLTFITNQPFPFNLSHRRNRRNHLPSHSRTNPYMEPNHGRHH
jgi:hypothetical protein